MDTLGLMPRRSPEPLSEPMPYDLSPGFFLWRWQRCGSGGMARVWVPLTLGRRLWERLRYRLDRTGD
jgi:hypothetical protein